jgi:peptidoglycan/xylan/chitin deacetylase (PgdA/CDA1 family)
VAITFDDGYRDTLTVALPMLLEFRFMAVCYLVAGRVGGFSDWTDPAPLMDWPEAKAWLAAGMELGSHSLTHRDLTVLDAAELRHEIEDSRTLLEGRLGCVAPTFAYPFNRLGARELEAVRAAGYESACAGLDLHGSVYALTRVDAHRESLTWFLAQLWPFYPELRHLYRGMSGRSARRMPPEALASVGAEPALSRGGHRGEVSE